MLNEFGEFLRSTNGCIIFTYHVSSSRDDALLRRVVHKTLEIPRDCFRQIGYIGKGLLCGPIHLSGDAGVCFR